MINQQAYESALKACGWEEESWKAYELVKAYVEADKPEQGVVDEDDYPKYIASTGNPRIDAERHADKVRKYMLEKQKKVTIRESRKPEPLPELPEKYPDDEHNIKDYLRSNSREDIDECFMADINAIIDYLRAQSVNKPLPELPEKWTNLEGMQANSTIRSIMGVQNQLIDCVKALYKEQSVNKRIN